MSNNNKKLVNNESLETGMGTWYRKRTTYLHITVRNTVHNSTITNTVMMQNSQLIADHITNTSTCQK